MIRDKFNFFVLDIFFEFMFFFQFLLGEFILKLFYDCGFDDLFRILGCVDLCLEILDNFEMFVFKVLIDLRGFKFLFKRNIFLFMYEVLRKNCFYVFYMIKVFYLKFY